VTATAAPTTRTLPAKEWLSAKEVAAYLGCSAETCHEMRKRGQLRARLKGTRTYQFSRAALLELDRRAKDVPVDGLGLKPSDRKALEYVAVVFERAAAELRAALGQVGEV
jgi:excisionase family DNA binding protein